MVEEQLLPNDKLEPVYDKVIRLIARTPRSLLAEPIWARLPQLKQAGYSLQVILSRQALHREHVPQLARFLELFGGDARDDVIRIAKFRSARHLEEVVALGEKHAWSGSTFDDHSERAPMAMTLNGGPAVAASLVGFAMTWEITSPISRRARRKALRAGSSEPRRTDAFAGAPAMT